MNNIKLTVLFVLVLIFIAPAILSFGVRYIPGREMSQTGRSVKIFRENVLEFNIENPKENLVGIGVVVKNPQRSDQDLRLKIIDYRENILRESVVNGLSIPDGALVKFIFSPLTFKGRTLEGMFSSDASEENAMGIYLEKGSDKVAFVSLYKPTSRLALISSIYGSWLQHFFADAVFAAIYLVIIISSLSVITDKKFK